MSKKLLVLSVVFYAVGVIWVLILHPLVSISSGETKPRSLFVDEHALPVHSKVIEKTITSYDEVNYGLEQEAVCTFISSWTRDCSIVQTLANRTSIVSVTVNPIRVPSPRERIFLGIIAPIDPFISASSSQSARKSMTLLINLAKYYRLSKWNAKQLHILLSPTSEALYSYTNSSQFSPISSSAVLIRESFLVDISDIVSQSLSSLQWQEISLITHDELGTQPNMDMISYFLHLHPYHGVQYPMCKYADLVHILVDKLLPIIQYVQSILHPSQGHHSPKANLQHRVDGYLHHLCSRAFGLESNHDNNNKSAIKKSEQSLQQTMGLFLRRNIDCFALQFHSQKPSSLKRRKLPRKLMSSNSLSLLRVIFDLIYGSNHLEEELHHSYHLYILMGEQMFVGMNEFALAGMVLSLSFLFLIMSVLHFSASSLTVSTSTTISHVTTISNESNSQSTAKVTKAPVTRVGHKYSASDLLTSLLLLALRYRCSHRYKALISDVCFRPLLTLFKAFIPMGIMADFLWEIVVCLLWFCVLRILSFMTPSSTAASVNMTNKSGSISLKQDSTSDMLVILRVYYGCELLISVFWPLLWLGIQDIASFYCLAVLLYLPTLCTVCLSHCGLRYLRWNSTFNGQNKNCQGISSSISVSRLVMVVFSYVILLFWWCFVRHFIILDDSGANLVASGNDGDNVDNYHPENLIVQWWNMVVQPLSSICCVNVAMYFDAAFNHVNHTQYNDVHSAHSIAPLVDEDSSEKEKEKNE